MIYLQYQYFVSYAYDKGYGCFSYQCRRRMRLEYVTEMRQHLQQTKNYGEVIILNWKLVSIKLKLRYLDEKN